MGRFGDYEVVRKLGQGAFGEVFEARKSWSTYAIKRIEIDHDHQQINKEVQSLSRLSHDNVVHFYASFVENNAVFIVLEYCNGGDLNRYVLKNPSTSYARLLGFAKQIIKGVQYLHNNDIIHRDIKPDNIMMCNGWLSLTVKLADFGLSRVWESFSYQSPYYDFTYSPQGPPYYTAPEIFNEGKVTIKSDIFSMGCVIMAIFSRTTVPWIEGKPLLAPYIGSRSKQVAEASDREKLEFILEHVHLPCGDKTKFQRLVYEMVQNQWRDRPNSKEAADRAYAIGGGFCNIL